MRQVGGGERIYEWKSSFSLFLLQHNLTHSMRRRRRRKGSNVGRWEGRCVWVCLGVYGCVWVCVGVGVKPPPPPGLRIFYPRPMDLGFRA